MSKLLFIEPSWFGSGLSNELFFIIYGIIDCINNKKENLIINKFRTEPLTNNFCEISEVLDIHHLNILLRKFNITIFDREKLNFSIKNINYGFNNNFMNLTEDIVNNYYTNNKLLIPSGVILNNIKGDPYPGEMKELIIDYNLNDNIVTEKYSEYIHNDIMIDLNNPIQVLDWSQIDDCYLKNKNTFDFLLKNIKFNNRLIKYSENPILINSSGEYEHLRLIDINNKKINVIHLRVEKDMTGHMLSHNKMTQEKYDINLQNKYIELIDKYFLKDDIIFVLSYDLDNNVIRFLRKNNYKFYISKKNIFNGREKHAIIDLLIGEKCNNIFIGNWNFDIREGSTFSYLLYVRNNAVKNIFIDMYNIESNEIIKYKNFNLKLHDLIDERYYTDKNTSHSYLDLYEKLLYSKKNTAKNILEIGIGDFREKNGASIKLWSDYFINANIYGIDILGPERVIDEIKNNDRIKIYTETNGYDEVFYKKEFLNKNIKFDMMLDDGPHTLESMIQFIKLYSQIMKDDGILIIEDVQSIDWIDELKKVVPNELVKYIEVYDLRHIKNRYDDIVFVINKNKEFIIDSKIDGANSVKYILENNIEGALVECGVDAGYFEEIWINELMKNNQVRDIYLYDTFSGLTEPGVNDHTCEEAVIYKMTKDEVHKQWESNIIDNNLNNWCYTPLHIVKNKLDSTGYPENKIHYIIGDVMETLKDKNNIPTEIAILRLDTDWYESTKVELETLYKKLVVGGYLIIDDYGYWAGCRKAVDEFFGNEFVKNNFEKLDNTGIMYRKLI